MAAKRQKARGEISLFSEKVENYKNDTEDETNLYQAGNNKNRLYL